MPRPATDEDWAVQEQLLRAAWYYYVDELTQDEIAKKLSMSRASAGRLLEKGRQSGIVTFTINSDYYDSFQLALQLKKAFGLREVVVLPELEGHQPQINARLGKGAAQYLQGHLLRPGGTLGLGWGATVQQSMNQLPEETLRTQNTVTLTGGVGAYVSALLAMQGSRQEGVNDYVLPTPIVASSVELATALRDELSVRTALERARQADHALVGIGSLAGHPTLVQMGYVTPEELDDNRRAGAVGDILGMFFDADGALLQVPIHDRRIGITLEELRGIPNVVGVAGGADKVPAILGALRGGYLDVLVTTEGTAESLLKGGNRQ